MTEQFSRRHFLQLSAAGLSIPAYASSHTASSNQETASAQKGTRLETGRPPLKTLLNLRVQDVERIWVNVPFRPIPARHMVRELPQWTIFQICKVTLACGVVGFGETMQFYTWATVGDNEVKSVIGKNAAECLWDDSLGAGLQMALFDAVAKANDVPIHRLLGNKVRDRPFVGWWAIDMPGDDWARECSTAVEQGYTAFKTKARPWYDLEDQCRILTSGLPGYFHVGVDFNDTLLDVSHATRVLKRLEAYKHIVVYETPIPQSDVSGNKALRMQTHVPIAMHYGTPPIMTALAENVCDVFVIDGGATATMSAGTVAAAADKPFWLQLVGTGITSTYALHFAAVLSHARWPSVSCHQLFTHQLIKPAMTVSNGTATVPGAPGLGVELDEDSVERFRIAPLKAEPYPAPNLLLAIRWPTGATSYYAHARQYWDDFLTGRLPIYVEGVRLEQIADDGSKDWRDLQLRARAGAVHSGQPAR